MIVPDPNDRTNLASLARDPWLNHGYDSIPSSLSTLSNDLLKFREEMAKKIEFLESQESSIECEIKRNGLQNLSLLIPVEDSIPKPLMPLIEKSSSAPHAFSSTIVRITDTGTNIAFRPSSEALIPIVERDSHSNPSTESSSSTISPLVFEKVEHAHSPIENETAIYGDTMQSHIREYCSAPTERTNLATIMDKKMDVIESINGEKVAPSDWKTRLLKWFLKPGMTGNISENAPRTKRRFSFLLRK
jgi:hypothetical protein